tara:strand:+ start:428 stop:973 length:546 start_codon:yes stop_codon:yes gene_type:complete
MKFNYLIKLTPLLSTLLLIIILGANNQKQYTKLRILIWNTPTLTLGSYIAISTGAGFIFSYFVTTNFANINQSKLKKLHNSADEDDKEEIIENIESASYQPYDYTLIERDVKDPSPTINAKFRIIGKTQTSNTDFIGNNKIKYNESAKYDNLDKEITEKTETIKKIKYISNDWNDESFTTW